MYAFTGCSIDYAQVLNGFVTHELPFPDAKPSSGIGVNNFMIMIYYIVKLVRVKVNFHK